MKNLISVLAFSFACSAALALPDIAGQWKCKEYDPILKKDITALGEIKKTNDTYSLINWHDEGSAELRSGTALHNEKLKNSLAVVFGPAHSAENIGFGLYEVKSKDRIVGKWAMRNGTTSREESCERVKV